MTNNSSEFNPSEMELLRELVGDNLQNWPDTPSVLKQYEAMAGEILGEAFARDFSPLQMPWERWRTQTMVARLQQTAFSGVRLSTQVLQALAGQILQTADRPLSVAQRLKTGVLTLLGEEPPWLEDLVYRTLEPQPTRSEPFDPKSMEEASSREQVAACLSAGYQMLQQLGVTVTRGDAAQERPLVGGRLLIEWQAKGLLCIDSNVPARLTIEEQNTGAITEAEQHLALSGTVGFYVLSVEAAQPALFVLELSGG